MTVSATNPFSNISGILPTTSSTGSSASSGSSAVSSGVSSSTGAATPTVSGLTSGINSAAIINALVAANAASDDVVEGEELTKKEQLASLTQYNTLMLSAQLDLSALQTPSTFQDWQATSSNTTAISTASAGGTAVPGTYELNVLQVAQAEQLATAGQSSETSSLGTGTVQIQVGNGPVNSLDFSAGGSLNDIATAINNANVGVIASVVNDGSSSPYRLVLQSSSTGAANTILAQGSGGLSSLFTGMTTLTNAADAQISIGGSSSGTSAITLDQASNTFTNVIPGVSITAQQQANNITVNVASNPTSAVTAITNFVNDYNSALTFFNQESAYNASTGVGGPLISDSDLRANLNSITEALTGAVPGLPSSLNNLSALGITINESDGTLDIDQSTLSAAVSANPNQVMQMFNNGATSTNNAVQFANLTDDTDVSKPFTVNITQAATQAVVGSTGPVAASTTIDDTDNALDMTINGQSVAVTLTNGTYTAAQLAQQVQTAVNAQVPDTGDDIAVSVGTNGALDLRSSYYGSNQTIQVLPSSTAASALGLSTSEAQGTDVEGTIDGVAATGQGQLLNGATGTAAAGLTLQVTASVPVSGVTVTPYKGLAEQANELFNQVTDNTTGMLSTEETAVNTSITDLSDQVTQQNASLVAQRVMYEQEFTEMETLISSYQSQGNYLTQLTNTEDASSSSSSG
jgi:flagellar hook-associated protein 2